MPAASPTPHPTGWASAAGCRGCAGPGTSSWTHHRVLAMRRCGERVSATVQPIGGRAAMADSVYRVTEVIGVSSESWEAAARNAVETAGKSIRDLRVAEVIREDVTIENGSIT